MEWIMANADIVLWLFSAIVFGIVEGVTVAVVSIWFVFGSIVALILAFFGLPIWLQITAWLVVSIASIVGMKKLSIGNAKKPVAIEEESDMTGKMGTVSVTIEPGAVGQVYVNNLYWSARAIDCDARIEEGARIIVCSMEGLYCIVEQYAME